MSGLSFMDPVAAGDPPDVMTAIPDATPKNFACDFNAIEVVSDLELQDRRLQPCCEAMPPEHFSFCRLVALVEDRHGRRYVNPLGERRFRYAPCITCGERTLAFDSLCDRCAIEARVRALTHLGPQAREALL
jgi:hypothetical protein